MFYSYLEPFHKFLGYITSDQEWEKRDRFKGGESVGTSYYAKWAKYQAEKFNIERGEIIRQRNGQTTLYDILSQNIYRLTALAGIERIVTLKQGLALSQNKFMVADNYSGLIRASFDQGFFRGYFRGYMAYMGNFLGVAYNSLLWANGGSYFNHLALSSLFEAVFFPLDTMKTLLNNDLKGVYKGYFDCLVKTTANEGAFGLFKGLTFKLGYNSIFIYNLRCLYDNNWSYAINGPLWVGSYALLTMKTWSQLLGSSVSSVNVSSQANLKQVIGQMTSFKSLYNGFLTYTLVNVLFTYNFYALYSDKAFSRLSEEFDHEIDKTMESKYERLFS